MAQEEQVTIKELFSLDETAAKEYLSQFTYPWEALSGIHDLILKLGAALPEELYEKREEDIWIARSAKVLIPRISTEPALSEKIRKSARAPLSAAMRWSEITVSSGIRPS